MLSDLQEKDLRCLHKCFVISGVYALMEVRSFKFVTSNL